MSINDTPNIVWQDPPPDGRARNNWTAVAAALRARPGEWALVASGASSSLATQIRSGRRVAFGPAGSFEAVSRKRPDGKHDIYARAVTK